MSIARQIKSRCLFIVFTLHVFTLHISRWVRPLMLINIVAHLWDNTPQEWYLFEKENNSDADCVCEEWEKEAVDN